MPFKKGQSGNPLGKRPGTRHKATQAAQDLLDGEAQAITRKAIEKALDGDSMALRLCLERLIPPRKDRPIALGLPQVVGVGDIPAALGTILAAVAQGEITPGEGQSVAGMLGAYCKAVELVNHEARLEALESIFKVRKK